MVTKTLKCNVKVYTLNEDDIGQLVNKLNKKGIKSNIFCFDMLRIDSAYNCDCPYKLNIDKTNFCSYEKMENLYKY